MTEHANATKQVIAPSAAVKTKTALVVKAATKESAGHNALPRSLALKVTYARKTFACLVVARTTTVPTNSPVSTENVKIPANCPTPAVPKLCAGFPATGGSVCVQMDSKANQLRRVYPTNAVRMKSVKSTKAAPLMDLAKILVLNRARAVLTRSAGW